VNAIDCRLDDIEGRSGLRGCRLRDANSTKGGQHDQAATTFDTHLNSPLNWTELEIHRQFFKLTTYHEFAYLKSLALTDQ
jgi:hypothetical protein